MLLCISVHVHLHLLRMWTGAVVAGRRVVRSNSLLELGEPLSSMKILMHAQPL